MHLGKKNDAICSFLSSVDRFADFINCVGFQGKEEVTPKELESYDRASVEYLVDRDQNTVYMDRYRDLIKKSKNGTRYLIFGIENQEKINYAMPVRNMLYDALEYTKQIKEIATRNRETKNWASSEEFLSGLRKTDRLMPIITFVFYHGNKPYDGCSDLHGMLKLNNSNFALE